MGLITISFATNSKWINRSRYNESQTIFNDKKESLTLYKGLILNDLRVVILPTLRSEILNILHQGHIGIEQTKLRVRHTVYWPGISKGITKLYSNCETCLSFRNTQPAEHLLKHDIPDQP